MTAFDRQLQAYLDSLYQEAFQEARRGGATTREADAYASETVAAETSEFDSELYE